MKIISFDDILSVDIKSSQCYSWVEEIIGNKNQAFLPPKISIKPSDGVFVTTMPSFVPGKDGTLWGGVKIVTRYPERIPSLDSRIVLMDAKTGEFLALMDGTWITTMRTGAVATHSTLLFAQKNFSTMGLMGLGNVSRATLVNLLEMVPDREFRIKLLRYKGQEEDFIRRFQSYKNVKFSLVDTPDEMAKGSEVIISGATYLPHDVCSNESFDEGVFVQPIHTLGFTNCDLFFDKVFVDDIGHVEKFKNFNRFRSVSEVSSVVNGDCPGRENENERILAYNVGVSIHDIGFAAKVYTLMKQNGMLNTLPDYDFKEPQTKYWI